LVQIATQVFPFLEIPNWAIRLIILLVAIGFPIALVIAWAFELTPEGLKRTEDVELPPGSGSKNRTWIYVALIVFHRTLYGGRPPDASAERGGYSSREINRGAAVS
jgi:hypothetical protein